MFSQPEDSTVLGIPVSFEVRNVPVKIQKKEA
jgi:hypothetical protein